MTFTEKIPSHYRIYRILVPQTLEQGVWCQTSLKGMGKIVVWVSLEQSWMAGRYFSEFFANEKNKIK